MITRTTVLVLLNAVAVVAFLWFASGCRMEPEPATADIPGANGGEVMVMGWRWALTALPILGLSAVVNLVWISAEVFAYQGTKKWGLGRMALSVPLMWSTAIYVDFYWRQGLNL